MFPSKDFITLLGPREKYTYKVHYVNEETQLAHGNSAKSTPANTQTLTESQPSQGNHDNIDSHDINDQQDDVEDNTKKIEKILTKENEAIVNKHKNLLTSLECPICFSSFALAHNVVPCGHGFCYECIHDWKSKSNLCPTCSGPIQSFMPNFIADQTIQGLFENDEESLAELEIRIV